MGIFGLFGKKKKLQEETVTTELISLDPLEDLSIETTEQGLSILLEQLPATYSLDEANLVEITDSRVLARINSLVPSLETTGTSVGNIIKNVKSTRGETLYKVILQKGGELADSRSMDGAKRAISIGTSGFQENANLIEVKQGLDKGLQAANVGAFVMGVSSMIVGQYYMHKVDADLKQINSQISKVIDFLDVQYKSEVASLIESVFNISKFQISSIENAELRVRELDNIQELKKDCQKLLSQAEIKLEILISKDCLNYEEYENNITEIDKWNQYQAILINLLHQLNILDFTLYLGSKSKEQSFGSFQIHTLKMKDLHKKLEKWHTKQCEIFQIDIDESRRKHKGLLRWLKKPISLINNDWNYQVVKSQMTQMIKGQTSNKEISYSFDNLFETDVEIISKNGKYYYLPAKKEE